MKHVSGYLVLLSLILAVIVVTVPSAQAVYYEGQDQPKARTIPGKVTVQFEDEVDLTSAAKSFGRVSFNLPSFDALLADYQVDEFRAVFPWRTERPKVNSGLHDLTRFYELSFPEEVEVQEVVAALLQNPNVRTAFPVRELPLAASPDDPQWNSQWAMEPGPPDPDFYDAWDIETGSDNVLFGCIDSGVLYEHGDLKENIWVNPGEDIDGDEVVYDTDDLNGIDDDGNGVVDDLIGYDFFSGGSQAAWPGEDGGGRDTDPSDFNGHGSHVAGIAAAMTNNNTQVTGAAGGWFGGHRSFRGARIMCLRVGYTAVDGNGYVNANDCAAAIDYATLMGVDVINASWGGDIANASAAANAMAQGVTFCHAAGNDNADNPDALDNQPGMISVAAVGPYNDIKASFSNWGYWIDVCAPGVNILSTYSDEGAPTTAYLQGTSMASPMVAGEALLIRSAMPSLTKTQVDSLIVNTADPVEDVNDPFYHYKLGSGRINAYRALLDLGNAKFTADVTEGQAPLEVNFTDQSPNAPTAWTWYFGNGDSSNVQNPAYTYTEAGLYDVSLIVDDASTLGPGEEHLNRYIWVQADTVRMPSYDVKAGTSLVVPVYLHNTVQARQIIFAFELLNHQGWVNYDSFTVAGTRTDYFASTGLVGSNPSSEQYAIRLVSNTVSGSTYLQPDTGVILNLHISVAPWASEEFVVEIDTAYVGGYRSSLTGPVGTYWPHYEPGQILVSVCDHGDANCDGSLNVNDLTFLVNYLFKGGPAPDSRGGDVDGNGLINVTDLTYLVNYLFKGGPPPPA